MPSREELVEKVRKRLERHSLPRLQMSLLLALTGATGFLSSFILLKLGVDSMALRYPVAVALAYGVFLLLLRIWLRLQRDSWESADIPDVVDLGEAVVDGAGSLVRGAGRFAGRGGNFGGGGASADFDAPPATLAMTPPSPAPAVRAVPRSGGGGGGSKGGGGGFSFGIDLDEGGLLVLVAVLVIAATSMGVVIWILWTAPALLAEVLVDGLVMTGLYRRLKHGPEPGHWLTGAIRRTWIPALVVALLFSIAGYLLQQAVPEARSIGAAWRAVSAGENP
ncbi:MAG TPA: hypothetical protein VLT87_27345 [Thermoanaerobaculia bacterium]|nr:hypothetical protein [Thermoanaerobaculia bacterium]